MTAKAVVIGGATFAASLIASVAAFYLAQPRLRANGFAPPDAPPWSLTDPPVVRAIVGTAVLVALFAVLALCVGAILRSSVAVFAALTALLVVPFIVGNSIPLTAGLWVTRLTPRAGFAIQRTIERYDDAIGPWAGLGVLCAYTAVAFVAAVWLLRRRDA